MLATLLLTLLAQTATRPWGIGFSPSVDHETGVSSYALYIKNPTSSGSPVIVDLGKPTPANNTIEVPVAAFKDLPDGTFNLTLRAVGPGGTSPESNTATLTNGQAPTCTPGTTAPGDTWTGSVRITRIGANTGTATVEVLDCAKTVLIRISFAIAR